MFLSSLLRLSVLLTAGLGLAFAVQAKEPATPEEYVAIFQNGTELEQEKAAQSLQWAGISSPQLFDLVEARALAGLPNATGKVGINYVGHLAKALAYSGNEKYRASLEKIINEAPHGRLEKHAEQALGELSNYTQYNAIIAPKPWPEFAHPSLDQRLLNMLNSGNHELVRMAAKRIHYTHNYKPELLAKLNEIIETNYQRSLGSLGVDTIAWACRALAGSRAADYRPTIEKVASGAHEKRLAKYAQGYLKKYGS